MSDKTDALMTERLATFKDTEKSTARSAAIRQMACHMSISWEEKYGPASLEIGFSNGNRLARAEQIILRCASIYDSVMSVPVPGE